MPSNQQRRDAERLHLQRELDHRRERELARRRTTLIASIVGTVVLVAAIVVVVIVVAGGSGSTAGTGGTGGTGGAGGAVAKGATVTFDGVSVANAADLTKQPKVSSTGRGAPSTLATHDLVVGKGAAASPTSTVTVQYTGVLYKNGKVFDSSWSRGQPAQFSLTRVVPGFTQGIGGTQGVPPMRVGGRRIMILPPSLGYGSQAQGPIPANSTLVFVVDLIKVSG